MLSIHNLTYLIAGRVIFENASLQVSAGQKVGLVGANGTGKSTLFKLICGELSPDSGEIELAKNVTVGIVRQDLPDDDTKLIDVVLSADQERENLLKEAETASDPDRIGYIYTRLEEISAYDAPSRAASILAGLGFNEQAQNSPISEFSGGWRMRVALASVLFLNPDLLMLDEPTNHLDFEAMVWLENYLMRYEKTLIIISHDRDILNKTATNIVHLNNKALENYTGNYDEFERRRAEKLTSQQAMHEKQMAQKAKMMKFVERFRAKASKARQAQSRLKAIEKMDIVDAVIAERVKPFIFPEPEQLYSPMIVLDDVEVGYDDTAVLKNLSLNIDMDDRIALLGANGNGKSTLVKLLSGRLESMKGEIRKPNKLKVGYFSQHQAEELDVTKTPYEVMRLEMKDQAEAKIRAALGKFGFDKFKADTKIEELSGGEKARLLLSIMSYNAPHIMLLDEPTNHLDMDAREALIQALNNYTGTVILVSHDPHLVGAVADRLWLVAKGTCRPYDGDIESYRELVIKERRKERGANKQPTAPKTKTRSNKTEISKLERESRQLEKEIETLNTRKYKVEDEIAVYSSLGNYSGSENLSKTLSIIIKDLEKVEAEWIRIQQQIEKELT